MTATKQRLQVLVVGPAPAQAASRGGMATVITLMAAHPDARISITLVPTYIEGTFWYRRWVGVSGMLRATWLVLRGRADILHIHLAHGGSVVRKALPIAAARWAKVPTVVHAHSYDFGGWFDGLPSAVQRAVRRVLVADQWLVLGARHVEEYASRLQVPEAGSACSTTPCRFRRSRWSNRVCNGCMPFRSAGWAYARAATT